MDSTPWGCRSQLRRRLVALVILSVVSASACTASEEPAPGDPTTPPSRGGTIDVGIVGEPATLDPYAPRASDLTYALVRPVFPMPYRRLPDGSVEADLARGLEVTGGRVELTLRSTMWSDGTPITARDVVASVERADPPSGFARVRSARATGPRTVVLRGDIDDWEEALATGAYVMPRGRLAAGRVSGGPFRFERYVQGRSLSYRVNDRWDGAAPYLDGLKVSFVQGTQLLVRLLQEQRLDAAVLPMSVNLDDRLDEVGIAYDEALGDETIALEADPDDLTEAEWIALGSTIDLARLVTTFIRDDGAAAETARGSASTEPLPAEVSIAAPEGDELLRLMQRAIQLDLQRSSVAAPVITGPLSTHYGAWRSDGPADMALVRTMDRTAPAGRRWLPIARVESIVAWRDGVNGVVVNPTLDGSFWNAWEWWIDPSI